LPVAAMFVIGSGRN